MFTTIVALATVLGPAPLTQTLMGTVVDGLAFESDIHWHRGDYARAGLARLLGAELTADDYGAYVDSAWLAWSWGHTDLGRQVCRRALERFPEDADAVYEVGTLVGLWGDGEWSLELLREAHRLNPADWLTAISLGAALRQRELWDEAAAVYRTLSAHHPGDPSAARFLGRYEATGHMRAMEDGS